MKRISIFFGMCWKATDAAEKDWNFNDFIRGISPRFEVEKPNTKKKKNKRKKLSEKSLKKVLTVLAQGVSMIKLADDERPSKKGIELWKQYSAGKQTIPLSPEMVACK